jgi:hypothetical protein
MKSHSKRRTHRWDVAFYKSADNSQWKATFTESKTGKPLNIGKLDVNPKDTVVISSAQKFDAHWQAYRSTVDFDDLPDPVRGGSPAATDPNDLFWKGLTLNSQPSRKSPTYFVRFGLAKAGTGYLQLKYPPLHFQLQRKMQADENGDGDAEILMIPTKQMIMRITIDVR